MNLPDIFRKLFADLSAKYPTMSKTFTRDLCTILSRMSHEGPSFATKTLPKLGKAIEASLETGQLVVPSEFKRSKRNKALPAFLGGLLTDVYDSSGSLVRISPDRLATLEQICFMAYKMEFGYTHKQEKAVVTAFLANESRLSERPAKLPGDLLSTGRRVLRHILNGFDPKDVIPRHGPGSVATGERLEQKWSFSRLYQKIHQCYPFYDFFVVGGSRELLDRIKWYRSLKRKTRSCAKVVLVPKDSRGPRLISCEPLEFQWIQQGLGRSLVKWLENAGKVCSGQINFTDQSVNQWLATSGSYTGKWATIDLKDASDLVSLDVVKELFAEEPILPYLLATRSDATVLPNGKIKWLRKFAPMGSALCFPVEALVFYVLSVASLILKGTRFDDAGKSVFVYGDDIICPSEDYARVTDALQVAGLVVNHQKSFHKGSFRESCGVFAYHGVDVTPVRLRTLWSDKASNGSAFVSWVAYANAFNKRGYVQLANYLFEHIERVFGKLPFGTERSSFPCRQMDSWFKALQLNLAAGFKIRDSRDIQSVEIRAKGLASKREPSVLDGWPRLLRNIVMGSGEIPEQVVLPRSTQIKQRWMRLA